MSGPKYAHVGFAALLALTSACSRQSTPSVSPSAVDAGGGNAGADGATLKVTIPAPISPVNDQQVNGALILTAAPAAGKFSPIGPLSYRFQVFNAAGTMVQDSGQVGSPSFTVTAALEFKKRHTWKVRAEFGTSVGPWSAAASFISGEGGFVRGNELFDPLFNGTTFGERIGHTTFLPGEGIRLEDEESYVRYTLSPARTSGEFSLEVKGLRANAPGGKAKVMAMSSDAPDFITDPYRVDIQYRGTDGSPPNAITFRALYGDADDLSKRYEPDTGTRFNSVRLLSPTVTYFWKVTWGSEVRVIVKEGGPNGKEIYNHAVQSPNGTYNPRPWHIYLGAPVGRSGGDSATIPGTIYKNVYIGPGPRPQ